MSVEDGLVMQLHVGSLRNHDRELLDRFGPDLGGDIPVAAEFTRNLRPLLDRFGNDPRLRLVLFTLDESTYSRELAPLAGYYSAIRLGPPWWFLDSPNGIARYLEAVVEIAGLANLAGFNDDARAFCSIPARHDLWRRATANWLAGLVARSIVDEAAASEMAADLALGLARRAYRLGRGGRASYLISWTASGVPGHSHLLYELDRERRPGEWLCLRDRPGPERHAPHALHARVARVLAVGDLEARVPHDVVVPVRAQVALGQVVHRHGEDRVWYTGRTCTPAQAVALRAVRAADVVVDPEVRREHCAAATVGWRRVDLTA